MQSKEYCKLLTSILLSRSTLRVAQQTKQRQLCVKTTPGRCREVWGGGARGPVVKHWPSVRKPWVLRPEMHPVAHAHTHTDPNHPQERKLSGVCSDFCTSSSRGKNLSPSWALSLVFPLLACTMTDRWRGDSLVQHCRLPTEGLPALPTQIKP